MRGELRDTYAKVRASIWSARESVAIRSRATASGPGAQNLDDAEASVSGNEQILVCSDARAVLWTPCNNRRQIDMPEGGAKRGALLARPARAAL